jgi:hypothetical protein
MSAAFDLFISSVSGCASEIKALLDLPVKHHGL